MEIKVTKWQTFLAFIMQRFNTSENAAILYICILEPKMKSFYKINKCAFFSWVFLYKTSFIILQVAVDLVWCYPQGIHESPTVNNGFTSVYAQI